MVEQKTNQTLLDIRSWMSSETHWERKGWDFSLTVAEGQRVIGRVWPRTKRAAACVFPSSSQPKVGHRFHLDDIFAMAALVQTSCPTLKLVARGKVRDIYEVPNHPDALLFVATDRVSAFDVIMKNVRPLPLPGSLSGSSHFFHRASRTRANSSRNSPSSSSTSSPTHPRPSTSRTMSSRPSWKRCPRRCSSTRTSSKGARSGSGVRRCSRSRRS